jgi:predicted O-methyltransferase YrrM
MSLYLNTLKDITITENIKKTKEFIDTQLIQIIKNSNELLEGNIFMIHHTTEYTDMFLNKAKNISSIVLNKEIKKCMEIGFNSGFSALLMLISNPNIHIECFDLGEHRYTLPCYNKLKEVFGDRITITIGDSTQTLPLINEKTYQLIHIDGGHQTSVANSDIVNSYRLSSAGTVLIMDDYDGAHLKELWDNYVEVYKLKPLDIALYRAPQHDIKFV